MRSSILYPAGISFAVVTLMIAIGLALAISDSNLRFKAWPAVPGDDNPGEVSVAETDLPPPATPAAPTQSPDPMPIDRTKAQRENGGDDRSRPGTLPAPASPEPAPPAAPAPAPSAPAVSVEDHPAAGGPSLNGNANGSGNAYGRAKQTKPKAPEAKPPQAKAPKDKHP